MANKFTDAMTALALEAASEPSWKPYAEWCRARAGNLHDRAANIADKFAETARHWPLEERKRFTLWLVNSTGFVMDKCGASRFKSRFSTGGRGIFASRVVVEAVAHPTLLDWRDEQPGNPEPYFWLGLYDEDGWGNLREALRLDPAHGPSRAALAERNLLAIEYDQHELPSGYLGDPADDLTILTEVEASLAAAVDPEIRRSLNHRIAALRRNAGDWITLRAQLQSLDGDARILIWRSRP